MVEVRFNTFDLLPTCQCTNGCVCENPADCPHGEGCECYRESQVDDLADNHIRRSIADSLGSEKGWTIIGKDGPYTVVELGSRPTTHEHQWRTVFQETIKYGVDHMAQECDTCPQQQDQYTCYDPAENHPKGKTMTQEKPEAFGNVFERLNKMTSKNCAQCGQVFQGLPETGSCLECQYKQEHPEAQDMYWTWKRIGWDGWGIVAHWPDREPLPNPGDQVSVHQKDGSSSTVAILKVGDLHYLPTGRARLECTVK